MSNPFTASFTGSCRQLGPKQTLLDGSAVCPFCGWVDAAPDEQEEVAHGRVGRIRPHTSKPGVLVQLRSSQGWRHYLDEQPVHCGTGLQVRWWTGTETAWLPCRYEMDQLVDPPRALLYVALPGPDGHEASVAMVYSREIAVRWPAASGRIPGYVDPQACARCGSRKRPCQC